MYDTVLLDLDGTLVDTVYLHTVAWVTAFHEVGLTVPSHRVHRSIGMGGDRLVAETAGQAAEDAVGDQVRRRHGELLEGAFGRIRPTDGATDLMEELRRRNLRIVLASSAPRELTDRLLDLLEMGHTLDSTLSGGDAEASKPDPDLVERALAEADAERAVLIGDSVWDARAAVDAGVDCVGLLTGGFGEAELRDAGCAAVYEHPRALLEHLDDVLSGAALGRG
jgi:phosphoglycolate phosphatase-like HAD superfamily hydrolase